MTPRQVQGGFFVTFEGPEGAGKTTQIERLGETLEQRGYAVRVTREPGGTALGEMLRDLLKHFHGREGMAPQAEALLFGASRAQLMACVIRPHLQAGGVVLCDRFADSTTVYQGVARGLDADFIARMHQFSIGNRWPDLTLLLDLDAATAMARARTRSPGRHDRIEAEPAAFHEAVRQGFLALAGASPDRIRVIDASGTPDAIQRSVMEVVDRALG